MKKWKLKLVLVLTLLGSIGVIAIIPYNLTILGSDQSIVEAIPISMIITINSVIQVIQLFILVLLGVRLQERVNLKSPLLESIIYKREKYTFSRKWLAISVFISLIGVILTLSLDLFVFAPAMGIQGEQSVTPIWWQGLLAMFYGGLTEELMMRLFGLTLIVWLLAVVAKKAKDEIPSSYYYISIFLTAILFGIGHLPATAQVFGELTAIIVTRTLVLNGLLGLWFGYLYWKKGLEYAIIAHLSADFFLHVVFVALFY